MALASEMIPGALTVSADAVAAIPPSFSERIALATHHLDGGRAAEAERLCRGILAEDSENAAALHLLAIIAHRTGHHDRAIALMERAVASNDHVAMYHRDLCEVYRYLGRLDDALRHGIRAVELEPNEANNHYNLGVLHYDRGEPEQVIECERRAIALRPNFPGAHFELAEALLLTGQFREGWEEYEWRFKLAGVPPVMPVPERPQWNGEQCRDLLLVADQGYGDVIQFCRYIPMAVPRCTNLYVATSSEIGTIIVQQGGVRETYARWEELPPFDFYCPLSGLPRIFGTDLTNIPAQVPYIRPDATKAARWKARIDGITPPDYLRIGIVWAGRPTHGNDRNRSITLQHFLPIAKLDKTVLVTLQKGPAVAQIGNFYSPAPLINFSAEIQDFDDTAAIIDNIDVLVAIDTSVVHLAAAMGRPAWVMLPFAPDWRWLREREDTPWYPTLRLFRQPRPGDWTSVIARVTEELKSLKPSRAAATPAVEVETAE